MGSGGSQWYTTTGGQVKGAKNDIYRKSAEAARKVGISRRSAAGNIEGNRGRRLPGALGFRRGWLLVVTGGHWWRGGTAQWSSAVLKY